MQSPESILNFWLDEVGPQGWYKVDPSLDEAIRVKFQQTWENAVNGSYGLWLTYPTGALAYLILTDQFSRNMFRDRAQAFSSDHLALRAAKSALHHKWDLRIDEPARQFFYLPLMHSENLADQERCVRLMLERMPQSGADNLVHAKAHREVIRRYGRFPTRNAALERPNTSFEVNYLAQGGYGAVLQELAAV